MQTKNDTLLKNANASNSGDQTALAVLDHLSGPSLGLQTLLFNERLNVHLEPGRLFYVVEGKEGSKENNPGQQIAKLLRTNGSYRLKAAANSTIWINGRKTSSAELHHNDVIEFDEKGPLSRFRLIDSSKHQRRYFAEICDDCWDYIRTSRKPVPRRLANAIGTGFSRVASSTTILFRTTVIVLLVLLGFVAYQQYNINQMQQQQLTSSIGRLENFAKTLARTRENALTLNDLAELKNALSRDLNASSLRIEELERKSSAIETVLQVSSSSVVFIQGSYGYREVTSGRVMRHELGPSGNPLIAPNGAPILSLEGDGPIAERTFTGTGFAIEDGTLLVTNRHVAVPWASDDSSVKFAPTGIEPFTIRLIGYSPSRTAATRLELAAESGDMDLALLRLASGEEQLFPLSIATGSVTHGNRVILVGYPTGLRSMIARSGGTFIDKLQESEETGFWDVARLLAAEHLVNPLASLGIVAQVSDNFVVFDAATTRGGSGSPLLNLNGEVIGIAVAIVPEYGGSNLAIPADKLISFLSEFEAQSPTN